jgi:hypothetical protein
MEPRDVSVHSVTVAEVFDSEGQRVIEVSTDGEPSVWDVLGLLEYAAEVGREQVRRA